MRFILIALTVVGMLVAMQGCGPQGEESAEETAAEQTAPAAVAGPEPVPLPEGWPEAAPIFPGLEITETETLDASKKMYKVVGKTRSSVVEVLDHYEKTFREAGWEEDMIMDLESTSIISFSKDGLLLTAESREGGGGSIVTLTTGALD